MIDINKHIQIAIKMKDVSSVRSSPLSRSQQLIRENSTKKDEHRALSPLKYLLQNNIKLNQTQTTSRLPEEIQIIQKLLKQNTIFDQLSLKLSDNNWKEISKGVVLIYCESPHIMDIKNHQLFLFLQGQGFEYMQNQWDSDKNHKLKLYENNQYVMLRKIKTNDYFLSSEDYSSRYHSQKKYQLMVDQGALLAKVTQHLFSTLFLPILAQRQKRHLGFLKKIKLFSGLPGSFYMQFTKFLSDRSLKAGEAVIRLQQKSKYVYFVESGQVEVRQYNNKKQIAVPSQILYVASNKPYSSEKLGQFQSFGMDFGGSGEQLDQRQVVCTTDCRLCQIDKRLLAIIIASFQADFRQRKIWSQINLNSQIKGQNYCTPQKQLLLKNAQRIRTSQRKVRDLKLRFLSSGKKNRQQIMTPQDQPVEQQSNVRLFSPEQKQRQIKTSQGRYRSLNVFKNSSYTPALLQEQAKYNKLYNQLQVQKFSSFSAYSQIEIIPIETEPKKNLTPLLRLTKAFEYIQQHDQKKLVRSHSSNPKNSHQFRPKLISKPQSPLKGMKVDSDMIGVFLDKKIKNEVIKKAEKVLNFNKNMKQLQQRNLKRIFSVSSRTALTIPVGEKKNIAEDIVERMSNLRDNPLLLQIESQRRKIERQMRQVQIRQKAASMLSTNKKIKKEDLHIVIKNNQ